MPISILLFNRFRDDTFQKRCHLSFKEIRTRNSNKWKHIMANLKSSKPTYNTNLDFPISRFFLVLHQKEQLQNYLLQ